MKYLFSILLIQFHFINVVVSANNYQHYSVINGLSGNDVSQITKHSSGLIYIATQNGLNRFDGRNFRNYKAVGTYNVGVRLTNDYINEMHEDAQGQYWITTKDKRLYRFNPVSEKFISIELKDKQSNPVYAYSGIYVFTSGHIWLASEKQGVFKIELTKDTFNYEFFDKSNGLTHTDILSIVSDNKLNFWILTRSGASVYRSQLNKLNVLILPEKSQQVTAFACNNKQVFLGNANGFLFSYDTKKNTSSILSKPFNSAVSNIAYVANKNLIATISNAEGIAVVADNGNIVSKYNAFMGVGTRLYADKSGLIWVTPRKPQIIFHNSNTNETKVINGFYPQNDDISYSGDFVETIDNRLLIKLCNGEVFYYDRKKNTFTQQYDPAGAKGSFLNNVKNMFLDNQNQLWYSTYQGGLNILDISQDYFHVINSVANMVRIGDVRTIFQDSELNIWIGEKEGKVFLFDKNFTFLGNITNKGQIQNNAIFYKNGVYAINEDIQKNIWIGTRGDGLYKLTRQKNKFNTEHFIYSQDEKYSLSNNHIYSIENGLNRDLLIGTWGGGVNVLVQSSGNYLFHNQNNIFANYPEQYIKIRSVVVDKFGRMWAAGQHNGVLCIEKKAGNIIYTSYTGSGAENKLPSDDVRSLYITPNNRLYIGTNDAGMQVFDLTNKHKISSKLYSEENILSSNTIMGFSADKKGGLWIPTYTGIVKINYKTGDAELYYPNEKGYISFSTNSICLTKSNKLLIGNKKGITIIEPDLTHTEKFVPKIILNQLKVYNQIVRPNDETGILETDLNNTDEIILKHSQAVFDIECIALDFRQPNNIQYAYMLEGVDHNWNYYKNNNIFSFKEIPAGNYVLRIKSTDSNGVWMNNERSIRIVVLNPFYKTVWAYIIYFILSVLIIYSIIRVLVTIYTLRNKIQIENELTEHKLNFFTVVSHELRTPLTLIYAPLEDILRSKTTGDQLWKDLSIAAKNSKRLIKLVNQLLDFRALQFGKVPVNQKLIVLSELMNSMIDNFSNIARQKNIQLNFECECNFCQINTDRDKLETIFFNLISNAIKYTPEGKSVSVNISQSYNLIVCKISDEGIGMTKEAIENIYKPFYTLGNNVSDLQASSGIGLSIVKEYCDLLQIAIDVESYQGSGTTFTLKMTADTSISQEVNEVLTKTVIEEHVPESIHVDIQSFKRILIVEDNTEMREYLVSKLVSNYNLICACDGVEGLELAQHSNPDLIITDILMPNKTGEEFVSEYRMDIKTSHIPIIVISAIDNEETKENMMKLGVEDYLVKPFLVSHLLLKIEQIFEQRRKLQMLYSSNLTNADFAENQMNNYDRMFLEKINEYMTTNLENSDISVNDLCVLLKIPYHILNNKIKQLLNLTTIEYIKEFRMQRAAELIRTTNNSFKEITYLVGINDQRYFSRCFKERFGVPPTQYKMEFQKKSIK